MVTIHKNHEALLKELYPGYYGIQKKAPYPVLWEEISFKLSTTNEMSALCDSKFEPTKEDDPELKMYFIETIKYKNEQLQFFQDIIVFHDKQLFQYKALSPNIVTYLEDLDLKNLSRHYEEGSLKNRTQILGKVFQKINKGRFFTFTYVVNVEVKDLETKEITQKIISLPRIKLE